MGTDDRRRTTDDQAPNAERHTPHAAVAWQGDAVQVLRSLEEVALRDLWAQTERLWLAAGRTPLKNADPRTPEAEHGAMTRARLACTDALELYSHAQGARAAAEQRARWRREEEDEVGDGDGRD